MTYLDHQIFVNIRSEYVLCLKNRSFPFAWAKKKNNQIIVNALVFFREFLGQAWMKSSKKTQAEHISQMTKRFNDGSRLVCSEIISRYGYGVILDFMKFSPNSNSFAEIRCKLVLWPLKNGRPSLISVGVCIILMVFCKCVPHSRMQPSFVWRKHGIKCQKRFDFTFIYWRENRIAKH